jgi:regulator of protease activity HflC (stomatin/prohibitin superfamily)
MSGTNILGIIGIAVVIYLIGSLRVLRQYERGVVFLLGKFEGARGPGLALIFVPIQQMVRVSLRTVTMQIPSQKLITKDNVSIDIAAVAYYHISDPEKAVIVIENVYNAINQISQTTVRNVVGRFSLDQLLSDTAGINLQIKNVIDGHTEPWGTKVTAVEIKDIVLPDNMQRAMAQEAEAERERRAKIVAAEGEYQAAVKLGQAADIITEHPVALQLRTLQTMAEISVEKNSTIIFPAQFMTTAGRKPSGGCRRIQHQNSLGVNPGAVAIQAAAIRDRDQARLLSPGRSDGSSPRLSTISLTCRGSSRCRILREGSKKVLIKVDARIAAHSQGQKRLWRPFDRHVGSTSK